MASLYCNNQVTRDSCFSHERYGNGRSCSKAQACLQKILHTISTIPPPSDEINNPNSFNKRGFEIDLNLRLGSFVDDDGNEEKSESLAENSFVGQNPADGEEEDEEIQAKTATVGTDVSSDVTEIQKREELKSGTEGDEMKTATEAGFNVALDLLIEAAEMISERDYCANIEKGKEVEEEEEEEEGFEDISPVVRSKRGRSQVLPHRFRDSVLEPWKKRPQTQSQRSTAAVSKKKKRLW